MRGQISLDFILAITIAFVAMGAVMAVNGNITETQKQASIRQQLDSIGNSLASVISASAALNDAQNAGVIFGIPWMLVAGEENPEKCDIKIGEDCAGTATNAICLSYDIIDKETGLLDERIEATKRYVTPQGMTVPASAECGGNIQIIKS